MANKVTTQWFDLQVQHGNYLPLEKQKTLAEIQLEYKEKIEQEITLDKIIDNKQTKQQLHQIQDDLDMDDQFTRQYMAKRYQELKFKAQNCKYGKVSQISKNQYVREVTQADPQDFVLLHLYQPSNQFCNLINQVLPQYAEKYTSIKFIKIVANKCIENFPDANCPCFIIYKGGKPVSHISNIDKHLKGQIKNLDNFLKSQGILQNNK